MRYLTCSEIVESSCAGLKDCREFIKALPAGTYSSFGPHARHVLDFYGCFIRDVPSNYFGMSCVNFVKRNRDRNIEKVPYFALESIDRIVDQLGEYGSRDSFEEIEFIDDFGCGERKISSTMGAVLHKLWDHAIHHYGIMRVIALERMIELPNQDFGIHPSTIKHVHFTGKRD
ncbi:hypothetical protein D6825_03785 [Candidatus Woesearchaeota archaeon]|nr:MAG: hypothetical protein D6825_03785 [Candidatus Woesearchaeota archaeon]